MSNADDRELERYLRGDDPLSRTYAQLRSERPSPALDQAVLARARDALKSQPRSAMARHRWTALTALAATVLLSFGLVMRLALEPRSQRPAVSPAQDSVAPQSRAPEQAADAPASTAEKDSTAHLTTSAPGAAPELPSIERQRTAIEQEIHAATEQVPATPENVPPESLRQGEYASPPAPASAPGLRDLRKEPAAPTPDTPAEHVSGVAAEQAPASAVKSQKPASTEDRSEIMGSRSFGITPGGREAKKEEFTRTPEAWLAEIARLRAADETEAADRELERFKKAYPEYFEKLKPHDPQPQ